MRNKRVLKEIAKRTVKTMLFEAQAVVMFDPTILTDEESEYIGKCMREIGDKLTPMGMESDLEVMVKEYFK